MVTGDALGLPVQFLSRTEVQQNPVTEMRAGGAFEGPMGENDNGNAIYVKELLTGKNREAAYQTMRDKAQMLFKGSELEKELGYYHRIIDGSM